MKGIKLKVIICSTSFHETDRRLMRIVDALIEENYKVEWMSRSNLDSQKAGSKITHTILKTLFKRGPLFYLEYNFRLFLKLLSRKQSIVCAVDLDTAPGVCWARRVKRHIITYDAHEIFYEVPELTDKPIKKYIWKSVARNYLPKIKYNYTVNQSLAGHYSAHYKTDYTVIRNIPPKQKTGLSSKKFTKTLVYLGVLNEGRGVELAIECMRRKQDYQLLLMGEGDLSDQLREQADGLSNVTFLGQVPPEEVHEKLQQADIGLNILIASSLNYKLSLANKFFDYLQAGLPSINMDYPEYNNILDRHQVGIAIQEYSVDHLSNAIDFLSDSELYTKLKNNCLQFRELYDWNIEKEKLIQLYSTIISG